MKRWVCVAFALVMIMGGAFSLSIRDLLLSEPDYGLVPSVEVLNRVEDEHGTQMLVRLNTQQWQGLDWTNHSVIAHPNGTTFDTAMIFITGSYRPDPRTEEAIRMVAVDHHVVTAALYDVPNQPLFGGLREDYLIAYTFDRYLETGDASWVLFLPMVRSVIRTMNWISQEFGVHQFVLAGASKRGWTTYLTAAVDERVKGIVPMAYDFLNFPAQLEFQLSAYGAYSDEISEYTELGLQDQLGSPEGSLLRELVDPFEYRAFLEMPKLIPVGANDPYWHAESWKFYLDQLPEYAKMVYVPNAGHSMEIYRPFLAIKAMVEHVNTGTVLPVFQWDFDGQVLTVERWVDTEVDYPFQQARAWINPSPTRDFRKRLWIGQDVSMDLDGKIHFTLLPSPFPYTAVYMELTYLSESGDELMMSTPVCVRAPDNH